MQDFTVVVGWGGVQSELFCFKLQLVIILITDCSADSVLHELIDCLVCRNSETSEKCSEDYAEIKSHRSRSELRGSLPVLVVLLWSLFSFLLMVRMDLSSVQRASCESSLIAHRDPAPLPRTAQMFGKLRQVVCPVSSLPSSVLNELPAGFVRLKKTWKSYGIWKIQIPGLEKCGKVMEFILTQPYHMLS